MYVMPRSKARLRASSALSSSLYMRNRLPPPMARIETRAPVRPRVRLGSAPVLPISAPSPARAATVPKAVVPRKLRREMRMSAPSGSGYRKRGGAAMRRLCGSPIQHPQPRHAREFSGVVRHEGGSAADGRSGDQDIEGPYGRTLLLEFDADACGRHRRHGIEGYVPDVLEARLQLTPAPGWQFRSERSVLQLVNNDGRNSQLAARGFVDSRHNRGIALQVVNDDIRAEKGQSRLSRGTSSP